MMKTAGIKSTTRITNKFIEELKQSILLFDKIGISMLEQQIEILKKHAIPNEQTKFFINELEFLQENNFIFDAWLKSPVVMNEKVNFKEFATEFDILSKLIYYPDLQVCDEATSRRCALTLNNQKETPDFFSVPLIKRLVLPMDKQVSKTDVIRLIIEEIAIPNENTPWQDIIDFKSNSDNLVKISGLKVWVNKAVKSGLSISEIKEELDYLLNQYKRSLELHKIKYHSGILETLLVGSAEILENTLKLNLSKLPKAFFSAKKEKADLLTLEMTAPGNELAYIYETKKQFS